MQDLKMKDVKINGLKMYEDIRCEDKRCEDVGSEDVRCQTVPFADTIICEVKKYYLISFFRRILRSGARGGKNYLTVLFFGEGRLCELYKWLVSSI